MAALSDFLENKIIDHVLRGTAYVAPATVYVALLTAAPTDAGGGTEVTGGAYARVAITTALTTFAGTQGAASTVASSGTGGVTSNNAAVTFPIPTAGWLTATHWAIYDAPTAGNLLIHAPLTLAKTINISDTVSFAAGALTVTLA